MRIYLSASQDSTIYQRYPTNNAGLDEILEIGKVLKPLDTSVMYASASARLLISFDTSSFSQYPTSSRYYLNFYIANAHDIKRYQRLDVYPISRSWVEGSGYFYQDIKNVQDGVAWTLADGNTSWSMAGGDYLSTPSSSYIMQKFGEQDIKIDVTNIMQPIASGTHGYAWNGLLVKFPLVDETSSINTGNVKVFSSNTHTVFSPKLEIVWNSQTFTTGSLKAIPSSNVTINPRNLKHSYTVGESDKVYFVVRDPYPDKRYDAVQRYRNMYYLPSQSYYRITDEVSGVVLHDFDSYSAINCDASGSFITLDTNGLEIDRYYKLDLKVVTGSLVFYPEFEYSFRVDTHG